VCGGGGLGGNRDSADLTRARTASGPGTPQSPWRPSGRPSVARHEHRQRFWEAIARAATSEDAGVEAGVSPAVGTRWFREAGGMPPSDFGPHTGRYLSFLERDEIAILRAYGYGVREIARYLDRSPSTVSGSCAATRRPVAGDRSIGR
jgi:hypothetical protein